MVGRAAREGGNVLVAFSDFFRDAAQILLAVPAMLVGFHQIVYDSLTF